MFPLFIPMSHEVSMVLTRELLPFNIHLDSSLPKAIYPVAPFTIKIFIISLCIKHPALSTTGTFECLENGNYFYVNYV